MPSSEIAVFNNMMDSKKIFVVKRRGRKEDVRPEKVFRRIEKLCYGLDMEYIDVGKITVRVISGLYSGVTTVELDNLAAETCATLATVHPDYSTLAARIFVSNLHKETEKDFHKVVESLYRHVNPKTGRSMPLVSDQFFEDVMANKDQLDSAILYDRDYSLSYFGLKTLEKAYLLRINDKVVERPQHLLMRVAVALHGRNLPKVFETYESMSKKYFIHATPTLFNAGTRRAGLSSCFLLTATPEDDSIENIYKLLGECAVISKYSGGIGISIHDIRAKGSLIMSTNGKSEGIIPLLGVFNKSARYVTQSNKRPGSIAVFIEPWHAEISDFLRLKEKNGKDEVRARDLFYGLWIPDLFMKKAENNEDWCLFCPNEAPGLSDAYGKDFEDLYHLYEKEGRYRKKISARKLFEEITDSQIKTGVPYMCYKDAANRKNNQKHIGTLRGSNLCVAPETKILTSKGWFQIRDLENQRVQVWNGFEFSETTVIKTNDDAELIRVQFTNGLSVECTRYHKFHIQDTADVDVVKNAEDLLPGDVLISCQFPVLDMDTKGKNPVGSDLYVPINGSFDERMDFIIKRLIQRSIVGPESFLTDCHLLLQTLGIDPLYIDGRLILTETHMNMLERLQDGTEVMDAKERKGTPVAVTTIETNGRRSETYCFNEPIRHLGVFNGIIAGNCTEIMQYTSSEETACCNLASLGLPSYVKKETGKEPEFDFQLLYEKAKIVTKNLDRVIDVTHYPVPKAEHSNFKHRPIGVGISGLADTFAMMRIPFDSAKARDLNKKIFETLYFACCEASCELAQELGPYPSYQGSEFSKGKFQWDLWEEEGSRKIEKSGMWDWEGLREKMLKYGMRNSLLTAPMPTASTSQILGFSEAFEPLNSNIYKRQTLSGEFQVVNRLLLKDLCDRGLWCEDLKQKIIANKGSIQGIADIPEDLQKLYKISWEISQRTVIDMSAERGPYVDQSQSLNIFLAEPTPQKLFSVHHYGWKSGLKTGMYYLKAKPPSRALQFSLTKTPVKEETKMEGTDGPLTKAQVYQTRQKERELAESKGYEKVLEQEEENEDEEESAPACIRSADGQCLSCSA